MTALFERTATLVGPHWLEAREAAHACVDRLDPHDVALASAHRATLARDVRTATALPAFTSSAMDGWAVNGPGPWRVTGTLLAGGTADRLAPGEAVVIATGAQVPVGTTAVLRSEDGAVDGMTLHGRAADGDHLRRAGEEAYGGEALLAAGTVLRPAHLGLAAAAGAETLHVVRRPTAAVLVLGDELLDHGASGGGRVRDALGPQLPAWLDVLGLDVRSVVRVPDTRAALVDALIDASGCDVVITTGGTAAGPVDHLHHALERLGAHLVVDSVRVRPGHPMLLARLPGQGVLLGLPGNPQAAIAALMTLGLPLLDALAGRPLVPLRAVRCASALRAPAHASRLVLARRDDDGAAVAVEHQGSAMLRGLAVADGYVVVPPGGRAAGARHPWLPLPH